METTIYVTSDSKQKIQKNDLLKLFRKYGRITSIRIKTMYSFVEFLRKETVDEVMRLRHNLRINGEKVVVKRAKTNRCGWYERKHTPFRLVVKNLSTRATWRDLKYYMMRCGGVVTYADVTKLHEGYVEYETEKQMETAYRNLNDTLFKGLVIKLFKS